MQDAYGSEWKAMSMDVYKVIIDKAEGEAYDKIKMLEAEEGGKAYAVMYKWFTDVSGLDVLEQARRHMHPEAVRKEEARAEGFDQRLDNVRRPGAHGAQYKLHELETVAK